MNATRAVCLLFIVASNAASTASAADMGTGFTYQGKLENPPGTAVDDTCDFRVGLWDAATLGNQVGTSPQTKLAVAIENGIFTLGPPATTTLDFGANAINGQARWLEIEVKCTGDAGFVMLAPRVEMTPAPHALALPGMYTLQNATSPNVIGGYHGNSVSTGVVGATISGGGALDDGLGNFFGNRATDIFSSIGGGAGNQAGNADIVINNRAGATIGGGFYNISSGEASVVGGGTENKARAQWSTVPGGAANDAGGAYSFAAGRRAIVRDAAMSGLFNGDQGTFVWADSQDADFVSTGPDQFLIRAENGVGIRTNNPQAILHVVGDAIISGATTIGASASINNHAYFLNSAGGPRVAIGEANYQSDEAVSIFGQDALAITGFQPFMTFYDTNAANARARIANAGGSFNFFPESYIGGSAAVVIANTTGRVGIGDDTPDVALDVVGDIHYTGVITDVSDERLKEDIRPVESALDKVSRLRGVTFAMKGSSAAREAGLIAQDVEAVLPEAVRVVDEAEGHLGVSYAGVTSLLVEAVKEVRAELRDADAMRDIEELRCQVVEKDREIEEMRDQLRRLDEAVRMLGEQRDTRP